MNKRLFVFSVDAMVTEDVDALRSMPNFQKYLAGGSEYKGGMRTIYPSVTYPAHVSILTGCYAGKHGITSNFDFTTTNKDDSWLWFSDRIQVEDIFAVAKKAGLNVRQVVTGEEIQFDPNGEDNKRGLAGAVPLYHVAAAAARAGKTLDEVAEIAQKYADNMASVTVKVTDATHPQNGMSFGDLGETDLMEIGAGQHGEGGGVRVPMLSAKDTVATVANALVDNVGLKSGDKAFVMINGCGATTMMEMLVLYKDTVEFLKAMGVEVVANMVGEILTVQEAGGFQMNIAKWDDETLALWNTPVHTPVFFKE